MNSDIFTLYVNHGGKLHNYRGPFPFYTGGKITVKRGLDAENFDYFDLCEEVEKLGYVSFERLAGSLGEVIYLIDDACVAQMLQNVREGMTMIILYVEGGRNGEPSSGDTSEDGSGNNSAQDGGFDEEDDPKPASNDE